MIGAILHLNESVPPVKLPGLFRSGMHFNSHSADYFGNLNCLFDCMREESFSQSFVLRGEIDAELAQEDGRCRVPRESCCALKIIRKVLKLYVTGSKEIELGDVTGSSSPEDSSSGKSISNQPPERTFKPRNYCPKTLPNTTRSATGLNKYLQRNYGTRFNEPIQCASDCG